ncbi:hypothetical protein G2W53_023822 [Senna tora]|uniref:Uncharacterized protein n=1 Tax=Senna tora TaxID=362788 RepID=A0A834TAN0_9FABA|nr:hypothetical protein G2W53_023822 [Senna tora]
MSSKMTMSELSLATSVPWMPIESPTSASFRAAIAFAVNMLSPVIILISTPASLQASTAFFTSGRHGSLRPAIPSKVNPSSLRVCSLSEFSAPFQCTRMVLSPSFFIATPLRFFSELNVSTWITVYFCFSSSMFMPNSDTAHKRIAFSVGLPEISEPIVSQAESFLTMACSAIILFMEYASVRVTANGRPSGIATTTIVTAVETIRKTALNTSSISVFLPTKATVRPTFPIEEVSLSRRACNGVLSLVSRVMELIISPQAVFVPTELLSAETTTTKKTATNMLPPSYHPSCPPFSLMPKPRERPAQTRRMRIVVSLKASSTKCRKPFGGGLWIGSKSRGNSFNSSKYSKSFHLIIMGRSKRRVNNFTIHMLLQRAWFNYIESNSGRSGWEEFSVMKVISLGCDLLSKGKHYPCRINCSQSKTPSFFGRDSGDGGGDFKEQGAISSHAGVL